MSKLLNLLSSRNRPAEPGEVPPDLRQKVAKENSTVETRKKVLVIVALAVGAVVMGVFFASYFESKASKLVKKQPIPATVAPLPSEPAVVQAAPSSAKTAPQQSVVTVSGGVAAEKAPAPVATVTPAKKVSKKVDRHPQKPKALSAVRPVGTSIPASQRASQESDRKITHVTDFKKTPVDGVARDVNLFAADSAEKAGDYSEALRQYQQALINAPDNVVIMNNIAGLHIRLGSYSAALNVLDKALSLSRDYVPALINRGIAKNGLGNSVEAAASFSKALELAPASRSALYNLALFRERGGDLGEAQLLYRRLEKTGDIQGLAGLGRVYEKQSKVTEAVRVYREILAHQNVPAPLRTTAQDRLHQLGN